MRDDNEVCFLCHWFRACGGDMWDGQCLREPPTAIYIDEGAGCGTYDTLLPYVEGQNYCRHWEITRKRYCGGCRMAFYDEHGHCTCSGDYGLPRVDAMDTCAWWEEDNDEGY